MEQDGHYIHHCLSVVCLWATNPPSPAVNTRASLLWDVMICGSQRIIVWWTFISVLAGLSRVYYLLWSQPFQSKSFQSNFRSTENILSLFSCSFSISKASSSHFSKRFLWFHSNSLSISSSNSFRDLFFLTSR